MFLNLRLQIALLVLFIACATRCDLVPELVSTGTLTTFGRVVNSVDWCTCQFLAAGGAIGNIGLIGVYQFDQTTGTLSLTGTTTTLGLSVNSVALCPSCRFLAAGGADGTGEIIQIYSFDPLLPGNLERVGTMTRLGTTNFQVVSVDWCPECNFLAAVSSNAPCIIPNCHGIIQVYRFDPDNPGNLMAVDGSITITDSIFAIKWCSSCNFISAVGSALYVYSFDTVNPTGLIFTSSYNNNALYRSVDWCDDCNYIAAGGQRHNFGIIDIYHFDPLRTPSLSLVTTVTISSASSIVNSVQWCQGCDNLAVAGQIGASNILQLYHFDSTMAVFSAPQTYSLSFVPLVVDWCGNCCDIAIGGRSTNFTTGMIQIFKGNTCLTPPTNLRAQKICHRFPTQVDIINQLCWDAVATAIAYNVYADAALTILLATIPSPTLCYSQHQICAGKTATYYVTAVDANGTQSTPAIVTI